MYIKRKRFKEPVVHADIPHTQEERIRLLYGDIVRRAIWDATSVKGKGCITHAERRAARRWLFNKRYRASRNIICGHALLGVEQVVAFARRVDHEEDREP